jgi:hypothetical protein
MDTALQTLLSWQFLLFSLAIAAVTWVMRKVSEYLMANYAFFNKESKLWRDLLLPISPIFLGVFAGLFAQGYPYPHEITSASGRMAFGLVAGMFSGLAYRLLNSFVLSKINSSGGNSNSSTDEDKNNEKLAEEVRNTINKE